MDTLLSSEDLEFKKRCAEYAGEELAPLALKLGEVNDVPEELKRSLSRAGIYGPLFPREWGGQGVSAVRICLAREVLAGTYGPADTTFAMQGLGGYPLVLAGNEEQKKRFLPSIVRGERLTTFGLTEPGAGSDVSAIETAAEDCEGGFVINGCKRFISNGHSADMMVLFAKTPMPEKPRALSAFIVERDSEGLDVARRIEMIASHDIVEFRIKDLKVPLGNLLGARGQGFRLAMQTLDLMRMSVGAAAVGMARSALGEALRYGARRKQFSRPLTDFQANAFKLAEMATEIEAARGLVYAAALKKDKGDPGASVLSSMAKYYATEAAFRCIDQAVQIHGGVGLIKGSAVERLYREIRPLRIYEGTTEIQKLIISNHILKEEKGRSGEK